MKAENVLRGSLLKIAVLILGSIFILLACTPTQPAKSPASPTPDRSTTRDATSTPTQSTLTANVQSMPASVQAAPLLATTVEINCTYTAYYWQRHPDKWLTENIIIGRLSYTKEDALAIMKGENLDGTTNTLREFFAAALNILKGADPGAIEKEIIQISDWLNAHPPGLKLSEFELEESSLLTEMLADYNNGEIGPGPCDDEPSTPTPSATFTETPTATPTPGPALASATPQATVKTRPGQPGIPEATPTVTPAPTASLAPPATATERPTATSQPEPPPTTTEEPTPTIAPTEVPETVLPPLPTLIPLPTFP